MNTSTIHCGTGTANRLLGLHRVTGNRESRYPGNALLLALLLALGALSTHAAEQATYKLFGREVGGYDSKADLPGIVAKALGPRASVADWDEIKKQHGTSEADLKAFCEKLGLAPNSSAWVTLGGKPYWQEERRYFVYRADHRLPEDFMLHDQLQDNFLLLGSWYETRPILVKITGYNAADAAKFAKWDEALAARKKPAVAGSKEIAGVYTLSTVNGQKVPATISHEGATLRILSGTFTITPEGTCSSRMIFIPPSGRQATVETTATYTVEGQKLDMQWKNAGRTTGTVEGNTFTMNNEGMVLAYQK